MKKAVKKMIEHGCEEVRVFVNDIPVFFYFT